jgi:hypothetical protein
MVGGQDNIEFIKEGLVEKDEFGPKSVKIRLMISVEHRNEGNSNTNMGNNENINNEYSHNDNPFSIGYTTKIYTQEEYEASIAMKAIEEKNAQMLKEKVEELTKKLQDLEKDKSKNKEEIISADTALRVIRKPED